MLRHHFRRGPVAIEVLEVIVQCSNFQLQGFDAAKHGQSRDDACFHLSCGDGSLLMQQALLIDEGVDEAGVEICQVRSALCRHRVAERANCSATAFVVVETVTRLELGGAQLENTLQGNDHRSAKQVVAAHLRADAGVLNLQEVGCILLLADFLHEVSDRGHRHLRWMRNGLHLLFWKAVLHTSPELATQARKHVVHNVQRGNGVFLRRGGVDLFWQPVSEVIDARGGQRVGGFFLAPSLKQLPALLVDVDPVLRHLTTVAMTDRILAQCREIARAARVHNQHGFLAKPFNLRQRSGTIEVVVGGWRWTLPRVIDVVELLELHVFPLQRLQHREHIVHGVGQVAHLLQTIIIRASLDRGRDGLQRVHNSTGGQQRQAVYALLVQGLGEQLPVAQHAGLDRISNAPGVAAHFDDVEAVVEDAALGAVAVDKSGNLGLDGIAMGRLGARSGAGLNALAVCVLHFLSSADGQRQPRWVVKT